jgi:hypothetical protein
MRRWLRHVVDQPMPASARYSGASKNATVVNAGGKTPINSLEVTLSPMMTTKAQCSGVGHWQRHDGGQGNVGLSSYSVFLAGFGFQEPGHLPGFSASDVTKPTKSNRMIAFKCVLVVAAGDPALMCASHILRGIGRRHAQTIWPTAGGQRRGNHRTRQSG